MNSLYDKGRQAYLEGTLAVLTDTIKACLVGAGYVPNLATHQFLSDLGANVFGTPQTLTGKTSTAGVFDANDVTFTAVATGPTITYIALYKDTGVPGTSPLIGLIDTATNMPLPANGGDIQVQWDNGANKIFKL